MKSIRKNMTWPREPYFLSLPVLLVFCTVGWGAGRGQGEPGADQSTERRAWQSALLEREGIRATRASLTHYFRQQRDLLAQAEALVGQLGDEKYAVRRRATQTLLDMRCVPRDVLRRATQDKDAEVRYRAQTILTATATKPDHQVFPGKRTCKAIIWLIQTQHMADCRDVLLDIASHHQEFEILYLVSQAVAATSGQDDLTALQELMDEAPTWRQAVVLPALVQHAPAQAGPIATDVLNDKPPDAVRLLTALTLLNGGERKALQHLVQCLNQESAPQVRSYAHQILRKACGQPKVGASQKAWRDWLAANGETVKLQTPIRLVLNSLETFLTRLQLYSAGFTAGNSCTIKLDGAVLIGAKGRIHDRRGINVLAVQSGEILLLGSYDVHETEEASNEFARDIDQLAEGCLVVVVAGDEPSQNWNQKAQQALESIGAKQSLKGKFRHAYYCIGQKGLTRGKAVERLDPQQGPIYYPASFKGQIEVHRNEPDEYRQEPRIRIKNGVRREVAW